MATNVIGDGAWTVQSLDTARVGRGIFDSGLVSSGAGDASIARSGVMASTTNSAGVFLDLLVTATTNTGTLQCSIAPGSAVVNRSGQGPYGIVLNSAKLVTLTTASGTNPRIDRISARVYDTAQGDSIAGTTLSGAGGWQIEVTDGTPAGSPVAPALPANSIPLATVLVPTSAVNSSQLTVTDVRQATGGYGANRPLLAGDTFTGPGSVTPAGGALGELVDNSFIEYRWTGAKWVPNLSHQAGTYTPTWSFASGTLGSGFSTSGRYFFVGNYINVEATLIAGTSGTSLGTGQVSFTVPFTSANVSANWTGGTVWSGGAGYVLPCFLTANNTICTIQGFGGVSGGVAAGQIVTPGTAGVVFSNNHNITANLWYEITPF